MSKKRAIALLCILIAGLLLFLIIHTAARSAQDEEEEITELVDLIPCVCYNGQRYYTSLPTADLNIKALEDLEEVGVVRSYVHSTRPQEEYQTNDPMFVGCRIYASPSVPNYIFIWHENKYLTFKKDPHF